MSTDASQDAKLKDHEDRIRELEKFKYKALGALTLLGSIGIITGLMKFYADNL